MMKSWQSWNQTVFLMTLKPVLLVLYTRFNHQGHYLYFKNLFTCGKQSTGGFQKSVKTKIMGKAF